MSDSATTAPEQSSQEVGTASKEKSGRRASVSSKDKELSAEDKERRDYKEELRALKKSSAEDAKELKKLQEQFYVPVVEYADKEEWKEACKKLEKAVEEFVYLEMKEPGAFPLKTLTNLEALIAEGLFRILQRQHKPYCEQKALQLRAAAQAASSAYQERVRDEAGFQLLKPYPDFNFSCMKHLLIGLFLEISNAPTFSIKRGGGAGNRASVKK